MNKVMGQNSAGYCVISLNWKDHMDRFAEIDTIEFNFGKTIKKYYSQSGQTDVLYDTSSNSFLVPLTQQNTQQFSYQIPVQLRVKYLSGEVETSYIQYVNIQNCISQEVI